MVDVLSPVVFVQCDTAWFIMIYLFYSTLLHVANATQQAAKAGISSSYTQSSPCIHTEYTRSTLVHKLQRPTFNSTHFILCLIPSSNVVPLLPRMQR